MDAEQSCRIEKSSAVSAVSAFSISDAAVTAFRSPTTLLKLFLESINGKKMDCIMKKIKRAYILLFVCVMTVCFSGCQNQSDVSSEDVENSLFMVQTLIGDIVHKPTVFPVYVFEFALVFFCLDRLKINQHGLGSLPVMLVL